VELNCSDAAPLMCAGMTTFNALRHSGANPGDTVAIVGLGNLGHLAVQFASKMGFARSWLLVRRIGSNWPRH
jgi:D-arabinose 1-dehydrogenase-like Zn-dependent alcohol dehydrogenase